MSKRRQFISLGAWLVLFCGLTSGIDAQAAARAAAFVKNIGDKLVAVINGPGSTQDKRRMLTQIIDSAVDVDGVAQFCLGRFWRQASPQQQQRFVMLFHQVLVSNIMAKLGEYQGVKFTVSRSRRQEDEIVSSVVERPNNPPTNVDWVIARRLAEAGFNVDDQVTDAATMFKRRASHEPPDRGGWSLFFNVASCADSGNPLLDGRLRTGAAAFFGWPDDPAMEELRERWLGASDDIEQKYLAVRIQETALADVLYVPLGRYVTNSAWRSNVSGILKSNQPVMWNLSKS